MLVNFNPLFSQKDSMLLIPATELNYFTVEEVRDNVNRYQQLFGLFGFMPLNNNKKFTITTLSGTPFMWQPTQYCTWTPTGNLSLSTKEISPCEAMIQEEWCNDELVNSMFKNFNSGKTGKMTAEGQAVFSKVVKKLAEQAVIGAWLTLTIGKLYDPAVVVFKPETDATIEAMFGRTIGTCRGWVELLKESALAEAKLSHLNVQGIFQTSDFDGQKYLGDPIALFDALYEAAPAELSGLVDEGGILSSLGTDKSSVLFVVTTGIFRQVAAKWRAENQQVVTLGRRISTKEVQGTTIYYIDDIPVIPVSYVNYMDKYLVGSTHLAAITLAGNIQLGTSFGSIPNLNTPTDIGIAMQENTDLKHLGEVAFKANSLFNTAIADPNYIVATQVYAA